MSVKANVVILAVTIAAFAAVAEAEEPEWTMNTELVIVDNCPIACPCLFGEEPHHGHCRFVGAAHIVEGAFGDTSLAGVEWAILGEFVGKGSDLEFRYAAFYVDSEATDEQKEAMRAILSGPPFATLGEQLGIKEASIALSKPEGDEERYTLRLGDLGEFSVVPLQQKVLNPVYPFPVSEVTVGAASGSFSDHGKDLNLKNNSGEISLFVLSSN